MPNRFLLALVAGLLTGLVVAEGIAASAGLFAPGVETVAGSGPATGPGEVATVFLALSWLVGACVSSAMATAISRQRSAGWLTGLLWLLPTSLVVTLAGLAESMLIVASLASLGGAIVGTILAQRIALSD